MIKKETVFLLDDNVDYARIYFEDCSSDFDIVCHHDARTAIQMIEEVKPDLIILDVHMPYKNGYEVFSEIKNLDHIKSIPVMFLSADETDDTVLSGLMLKPEEFLFKTMSPLQVKMRIKNRLERTGNKGAQDFEDAAFAYENLKIDHKNFKIFIDSKPVELTSIEYRILYFILSNMHNSPTKDQLVDFVWGDDFVAGRTVNTHLSNLRSKISAANFEIRVGRVGNRIRVVSKEESYY